MGLRNFWSRGQAKGEGRGPGSEAGRGAVEQVRRDIQSAVGDALRTSFEALSRSREARPKILRHDAANPGERARDAVYRDRGLHASTLQSAQPAPARGGDGAPAVQPRVTGVAGGPVASSATAVEPPRGEPICTRTMARLLAQQGHGERALNIYTYLLAQRPDDELQREVDALREALASEEA